ncbi:MAG: 5-deoxy-glucuronate isomerase, partial [Dermabacteraceae bacterium]
MTTSSELHLAAGSTGRGNYETIIDPGARDDWVHTGLRVLALTPGSSEIVTANGVEAMIVPLNGGCQVAVDGQTHTLRGREDVFAAATDVLYVPVGSQLTISSQEGGRFALATAVATGNHPVALIRAEDVPVEVRGGGNMTRKVRNFGTVGAFDAMDSLIACEVITPGGNWSSYPAHKHDETIDDGEHRESELEEIYYYEIQDAPDGGPGFGFHQTTSSGDGKPIDVLTEVRSG